MVFRIESEFDRVAADGRADGASDGWAGDLALALVGGGQPGMSVLLWP